MLDLSNHLTALPPQLLADLQVRYATSLVKLGQLEEAEALLNDEGLTATDRTVLADAWLRLGRAWRSARDGARAEIALRRAAELGSVTAHTALAQHLESQQRFEDAERQWREAITLAPQETGPYLNLARLYERLDRPQEALGTFQQLVEKAASTSLAVHLMVAERLDSLAPRLPEPTPQQLVRIALLGNATLDHLHSYLKVECYKAGLRPVFFNGGFDQYTQQLLDPGSELYAFEPDFVILAVHASRLFPQIHDYPFDLPVDERHAEIDAGLASLQSLLDAFSQRSSAMVLLHTMVAPHCPALGILDARDELGQAAAFATINMRLAELARTRYRNVFVVDEDRLQGTCGKADATDQRMWLTARMPWGEPMLQYLSAEYLRYIRAARGLSRKCLVLDLDNTLWGGVIGEDGMAGIQLGSEAPGNGFVALQKEIVKLWRRGILLAICSKNNPEDALQAFDHPDMVLKLSHFAAQRINWMSKADNIREIAAELNLGLDSFVFVDDNPAERALVRSELPQVLTVEMPTDPANYRRALLVVSGVFDTLALTAEDRRRNQLYAEERARRDAQAELHTSGSLEAYLTSLDMTVEIEPVTSATLSRVAQLTNKTNQFNLTTRRYTEADIAAKTAAGATILSARVRDRFGDNGLTGVLIAEHFDSDAWTIDTMLLSCRVMGRGVETALLSVLIDAARTKGARRLLGAYVPTAKNGVVRDMYRQHEFRLVEEEADGRTSWELDVVQQRIEPPVWLKVRSPVPA